jgi:Ca2+-binding RTX toxin-like protein
MMADLFGNNLANNLTEGVAADNILGASGNDTLNGDGGNDSIYGDSENDSLNSGAGEDFVYGGSGNDALNAVEADIDNGIGGDVYIGEGKDTPNTLEAVFDKGIGYDVGIFPLNPSGSPTSGDDTIIGTPGPDIIRALAGNDTIDGREGNDRLYGDSGNDLLYARAGLDSMYGGSGNDTLNAEGSGKDNLFGGTGNDVYIVIVAYDDLVENRNEGTDIVRSSAPNYTLGANVEHLILTPGGIDGTGNNLNNQITGNSRNNTLNGGGGNDTLNGGGGNDNLNGGGANDILNGGGANDILNGGLGSDEFLFNTPLATAGVDRITDFSSIPTDLRIPHDKIVLDKSVFSALDTSAGNFLEPTDFATINVAAAVEVEAAGDKGAEIVYNRRTGNLFYNPNNSAIGFGLGGGQFATIVGSPDNLSNRDFRVVR